jgi:hypothetical protein
MLPTLSAACPLQANPYDKPSNEPKRSRPVPDLPLALPSHPYTKAQKDKEELLIEAVEEIEIAEWPAQDAVSTRIMSIAPCSPETGSAAIVTSIAGRRIYTIVSEAMEGALTPCSNKAKCLALSAAGSPASPNNDLIPHKIIGPDSNPATKNCRGEERQPDQDAVSKMKASARWCLPESAMAIKPPIAKPVSLWPVFPLLSGPESETWLRWKPPDYIGGIRQHACHVVNKKIQGSVKGHSPLWNAALVLPIFAIDGQHGAHAAQPKALTHKIVSC